MQFTHQADGCAALNDAGCTSGAGIAAMIIGQGGIRDAIDTQGVQQVLDNPATHGNRGVVDRSVAFRKRPV